MPQPPGLSKWRKTLSAQDQSAFFNRFPREIRDLIYRSILQSQHEPVHLFLFYDRLQKFRAKIGVKPVWQAKTSSKVTNFVPSLGVVRRQTLGHYHQKSLDLTWLLSCQAIYNEAFDLLYFVPAISIHDICTFDQWWTSLSPHHLNKVHSLDLEFSPPCTAVFHRGHSRMVLDHGRWTSLVDIVAAIKGLRTFNVRLIKPPSVTFSLEELEEILRPFMRLQNLETFRVHSEWLLGDHLTKIYADTAPFDLTSGPKRP